MGFHDVPAMRHRAPSLADQIRRTLEGMLCEGTLKPDDRTSIREIAERLGVSTMPVRDAVSRLAATGALAVERNRAVRVPRLSAVDFEDLTQARILIETEATRRAARRMTSERLAELAAINTAFSDAMTGRGEGTPVAINQHLHFRLYETAGSPTLFRIIEGNWLRAGPMINLDIGLPSRRSREANSMQCHAALVEALQRGDEAAAAAAIERDIRTAADAIALTLKTNEEGEEER